MDFAAPSGKHLHEGYASARPCAFVPWREGRMSNTFVQDIRDRHLNNPGVGTAEKERLTHYFALSSSERSRLYAPTASTAQQFGISRRTLQAWIEAGFVQALRIGRNYRVYVPSVEVYLRGCNGFER
jgi:excisionase family DNA binding protein